MRWIIRGIGALLLIIVVMLGSLFLLPGDRIARIASDQLSRMTGRAVSITGDVGVTLWPVLGVTAGGLEVGNADWTDKGAMLTAANAAIGVDAGTLLRGEIRITNIAAQSPVIRLEQRLDGRASWQFTDSSSGARIETQSEPTASRRPLSIQKLTVTDATLIYDAEGADVLRYEGVDLALDWPERGGAADIT
ncbi:AsmA family protein, partial [Sulfitobacter sp. HI0076]